MTGFYFLYWAPGMPFGWLSLDRPDGDHDPLWGRWKAEPSEDFAGAAGGDLERSGLVRSVSGLVGGAERAPRGPSYHLRGRIRSTRRSARVISYGLSLFAPIVWILGPPAGTEDLEVAVRFELWRPDKGVLWSHESRASRFHLVGLYYNLGMIEDRAPELFAECFAQALPSLDSFLRGQAPAPPLELAGPQETPRETIVRLWRAYEEELGDAYASRRDFFEELVADLPPSLESTWRSWEERGVDHWNEVRNILARPY